MFPSLFHMAQWLNATPWSTALREGDWAFPAIETIHLLGLAFSVGIIMWVDLRLLGLVMKEDPISDVITQLEPWAIGGFTVMFITGFLLFLSEPVKCYTNGTFFFKMLGVFLAGLNVLYFDRTLRPNMDKWGPATPWQARMVGATSLFLWFSVIALGRYFAYT